MVLYICNRFPVPGLCVHRASSPPLTSAVYCRGLTNKSWRPAKLPMLLPQHNGSSFTSCYGFSICDYQHKSFFLNCVPRNGSFAASDNSHRQLVLHVICCVKICFACLCRLLRRWWYSNTCFRRTIIIGKRWGFCCTLKFNCESSFDGFVYSRSSGAAYSV